MTTLSCAYCLVRGDKWQYREREGGPVHLAGHPADEVRAPTEAGARANVAAYTQLGNLKDPMRVCQLAPVVS
jgi:hypothetical protein